MARAALADLLVRAEAEGDTALIADMQSLSLRLGEEGAENFLMRCDAAPDAMASLPPDIGLWLREILELPTGDVENDIESACADTMFDVAALSRIEIGRASCRERVCPYVYL